MPTAEAIYLLTAFANMAASRHHTETTFVEAITSEIYQVGPYFSYCSEEPVGYKT